MPQGIKCNLGFNRNSLRFLRIRLGACSSPPKIFSYNMAEIERNMQEGEQFSRDDGSSGSIQNSEDMEEDDEEEETELGRAL